MDSLLQGEHITTPSGCQVEPSTSSSSAILQEELAVSRTSYHGTCLVNLKPIHSVTSLIHLLHIPTDLFPWTYLCILLFSKQLLLQVPQCFEFNLPILNWKSLNGLSLGGRLTICYLLGWSLLHCRCALVPVYGTTYHFITSSAQLWIVTYRVPPLTQKHLLSWGLVTMFGLRAVVNSLYYLHPAGRGGSLCHCLGQQTY